MVLLNIYNYLAGAVKIRITGNIPEKFINLCIAQHIFLWGIKKDKDALYAWLRLPDFFRIREIVRISQTQVEVIKFFGMPFLVKRMKQRKMLVMGGVLFFFALHILSSYIWFVDITGLKTIPTEKIMTIVLSQGLRPGVSKETVDTKLLEKHILLNIPEAAWVGVSFTGTRAVIEVVEKTLPKTEDKSPAHIVAGKDGVVAEIIILAGQAAVKKGDTIKKGDILVKGFAVDSNIPASPQSPQIITIPNQLLRANGIVRAQVWYESYGEALLVKEWFHRTGNKQMAVDIFFDENQYSLKKVNNPPYAHFETEVIHKKIPQWRNSQLTVETTISIYHEVEVLTAQRTMEEAREEAKSLALQGVQNQIPENAQILSRNVEVMKTNEDKIVRVKARIETIEEVGQLVNIQ